MPAWLPWAIQGGVSLLGGILGNRSSNRAGEREYRAAMEALAYQKEQDAYRRKVEEEERAYQRSQDAMLNARYEAEMARLAPYRALSQSILGRTAGRLGLNVPGGGSAGIAPGGMIPERATALSGSTRTPSTLADIAMSEGLPASSAAAFMSPEPSRRRLTLADLGNWSEAAYRG